MYKNIISIFLKYFSLYFILLVIFISSLVLSSRIPSSKLKINLGKSISILASEGLRPLYGISIRKVYLDNFTDSLMFNIAYSVDYTDPIKSALINSRYDGVGDGSNKISNLKKLYDDNPSPTGTYERYWHGYLIWLRPALLFFSFTEIRVILKIVLFVLGFITLYLSYQKIDIKFLISVLVGLISVDFFYLGQSIQFSGVFIIGFIGAVYMLIRLPKNEKYIFFIIGGLTSYFDLLTAPLITLEMLLIYSTVLNNESVRIKKITYNSLIWSIGYLLFWSTKWVLVMKLYLPNAFNIALKQTQIRTYTSADSNFTLLNTILLNIYQLFGSTNTSRCLVLLFILIIFLILLKFGIKSRVKRIVPWIFLSLIPYIWYLLAANHSYVHYWFTYRDQFITVVGMLLSFFTLLDENKVLNLKNKFIRKFNF